MVVTVPTEFGEATVADLPSGLKAVTLARPAGRVRVGTVAPLVNKKFYAVPVAGETLVARSLEHAVEWLASQVGARRGWTS